LEPLGIARNWPSQKREFTRFAEYSARFREKVERDLTTYALTGDVISIVDSLNVPRWQLAEVTSSLSMRALDLNQRGQIETVETGVASPLLALSFACAYIPEIIKLHIHETFPRRFPGRTLQTMSLQALSSWLSLGLAVGCWSADRFGRLALEAARRQYLFDIKSYPIFHFIMMLFASSQQIRVEPLSSAATREPVLTSLLENWRTEDLNILSSLVVAACDFHTHRCKSRTEDWNEFGSGVGSAFTRMPIEILMVYRLREREGLENPNADHPLMSSPVGKLYEPMTCEPDTLLSQVLDRARSQGFDEEAIVSTILGEPRKAD
jgi:hypothetical protein